MAERIALKLHGTAQGDIHGENPIAALERENTIEVLSLTQTLKVAFDRATLQATGRRFYEPLEFTKPIDRSTPLLRQALVNNENVTGEFVWYRLDSNGQGEKFFSLKFSGGRIASASLRLPDVLLPPTSGLPPMETISLVFSHVEWTHLTGSTTSVDDWDATR